MKLKTVCVFAVMIIATDSAFAQTDIPYSGCYKMPLPPGSVMMWADFHYEKINSDMYLIRSKSGASGCRQNTFSRGRVVSKQKMMEILIENR